MSKKNVNMNEFSKFLNSLSNKALSSTPDQTAHAEALSQIKEELQKEEVARIKEKLMRYHREIMDTVQKVKHARRVEREALQRIEKLEAEAARVAAGEEIENPISIY